MAFGSVFQKAVNAKKYELNTHTQYNLYATWMEISLVEKNISSLEDGICVETNAAFVLHFALHLEEKTEGRKLKQKKNNDEVETLKATRNRARQEKDGLKLTFFLFPIKSHFHFHDSSTETNGVRMSLHGIFHHFWNQLICWVNERCFLKSNREQEQRDVSSVGPRSSCIKTAPRWGEKLYELKMWQMLQRNKIKMHRHDET